MGHEVVYCHRCQTRLRGDDFEKGAAYRVGDKITCSACLDEIASELPLTERLSLLSKVKEFDSKPEPEPPPRKASSGQIKAAGSQTRSFTKTRSVPPAQKGEPAATGRIGVRPGSTRMPIAGEPPEPPAKSRLPLILGAAGGAAVLLVVLLVLALGGRKKETDLEEAAPEPRIGAPSGGTAVKPPDAAPKGPLDAVRQFCKDNPQDLAGHVKAWEKIVWEVGGEHLNEAKAELEAAKKQLKDSLAPELAAVEEKWREHLGKEEYKAAQDFLETAQKRYEMPDWTLAVDKRIRETQDQLAALFATVRQQAVDARLRNNADEMRAIRDRVAKWGLEGYISDIKLIFEGAALGSAPAPGPSSGPTPAPAPIPEKPLTREGQAYREQWTQAAVLAIGRKYEDAVAELVKASKSLEEAEVKEEARRDIEFLQQVAAFTKEAFKALAEAPLRSVLSLAYYDESGARQAVSQPVSKTDPYHVEFKKGKQYLFIDFQDVTGDSLADILRAKRRNLPENDRRAAAILCLLEGEKDKAASHLGGPSDRIPAKYWNFAAEARSKAPKPDSKEVEARRLFYTAEREFRTAETRGNAIEKYKYLRETLAVTEVVRRYQETILRRAESAKESVLVAGELTGSGFFKMAPHEGLTAWICGADVTNPQDALTNYVDVDFYALPQTPYRCWLFMGACCQETFICYMQATELMGTNPRKTSEKVPYEPGKGYAAEVKLSIPKLKKTHAQHGGPKQPSRWEWVEISLPKYAAAGPKKLRILSEQQGFSIAFAVVSSLRKSAPDEAETKELAKVKPPPPDLPDKGSPEPKEWYLAYPFEANIGKSLPPEGKIDLQAPMKGKGNANVKWTLKEAQIEGNHQARFDFKPFPSPNDTCVYVLTHVLAPSTMNCKLLIGSDDGVKVWVNGQSVHVQDRNRAIKVDEDQVNIKLNAGWNRLLLKVRNRDGDYGLVVRLADSQNRPVEGLMYDATGDLGAKEE